MMSVKEYAEDVNRKVEEILKKCEELGIQASTIYDMLSEDDIIDLDNVIGDVSEEDLEELAEDLAVEIADSEKIDMDHTLSKQKLNKKSTQVNNRKKELATKKKEMYKHKEKLISNTQEQNESVVLYKDGMTVAELAERLHIAVPELVKKLFMLGVMATANNIIIFLK